MHGQNNIKFILVSSVGFFFSYVNDARSHEWCTVTRTWRWSMGFGL